MRNRPVVSHVSLDDIRALFAEQREMLDLKLGELRREINARFNGINRRSCVFCEGSCYRSGKYDETEVEDVVREIGGQKLSDEYGRFGCGQMDDEAMPVRDYCDDVRDDCDDVSLPNTLYDEQHVEVSDMNACNVDSLIGRSSDVSAPPVDLSNVNVPLPSRPRSIRVKMPNANTRTSFTRSDRRKSKKND